jgi:hypothetical protein
VRSRRTARFPSEIHPLYHPTDNHVRFGTIGEELLKFRQTAQGRVNFASFGNCSIGDFRNIRKAAVLQHPLLWLNRKVARSHTGTNSDLVRDNHEDHWRS